MSPTAVPPSPQEIQRKLSVHSVTRPKIALGQVSGTESDSDSVQTPDVASALMGHSVFHIGNASQPPLSSIAERSPDCGVDTDEEDAAGGWRTPDARRPKERGDSVIKTGYLSKKGMRRRTWKKRWFVLRPAHLAYYKSNAEYQTLKLLDLSDIHSCTPVHLKGHENSFCLISPNRTFYFQAPSADDMRSWVSAIEETRQTLLATSTQNSASTPIPISAAPPSSRQPPALTLSSSPGHLHAITSSDSEDGGGMSAVQRGYHSGSAPSPIALNFAPAPTKPPFGVGAANPSKVILSGYLMKCGSKRRTWRKRWFVLTSEKLVYSGSHMDMKHQKSFAFSDVLDALEYEIPARHTHVHSASASPPTGSSAPESEDAGTHTFKIVTTKRTLLLCAPCEEDEIKWLGAIRALIARRSDSGVVPGDKPKPLAIASGLAHRSGDESGSNTNATTVTTAPTTSSPLATGGVKTKPRRMSVGGVGGVGGCGGSSGIAEDPR